MDAELLCRAVEELRELIAVPRRRSRGILQAYVKADPEDA